MDLLHNIGLGFSVSLTAVNLLYCLAGVFLGTLIGVLPGLGPTATIAMLLPVTFTLPPVSALIMLAGIYYGSQYGGSTTSILVNVPGEAASVVTALDGYQMARKGRAGVALATSAIGSFFAGTVATVILALFAPPLAEIALKFGPAEFFSLMVLGLLASMVLARGSLLHAMGMIVLGLLLGLVGADVNSGTQRFTFGIIRLADGIGFVVVAMGMFGLAEIIRNLENEDDRSLIVSKITNLMPSREDWKRIIGPILRGTVIGSILGILPGSGSILGSFAAYAIEKKVSKNSAEFGKGAIEGVAAPESANNAGAQTSFIPMLTLGIPANPVMALMIGAMIIQGIQPGPSVITEQPQLFWGIIVSMWIGNLFLVVLNLPLIGMWVRLVSVPYQYPLPGHPGLLRHRRLQPEQHGIRRLPHGHLRRDRLHLRQTRLRTGTDAARLHPRADDGRVHASRIAAFARQSPDIHSTPDQRGDAGARRAGDHCGESPGHLQEAGRNVQRMMA